ncbi:MAG: sulfatase-like hydrolase/transferase [Deltaproteobacteria bacterium]|nr:sulfatase-like hydrolase/transferase [Deltaproteobacteria bacterium]
MMILLEIAFVALLAILVSRFAPEPWRGRILNVFKAWVTFRAFWLLVTHPVQLETGEYVIAWKLIQETLRGIDAGTFWLFVTMATGIKFIGILASMYRWIVLLRGQKIQLPFKHIFGSFLIGRFIGTFLPSTAGLDGYKLYDASRFSGRTVETTAATFLEKVLGVTGIFLTYLVSLPFGVEILRVHLGDNTETFAAISIALVAGIIGSLLTILFFPGLVQWVLNNLPIPGKRRLEGIVLRLSTAAAAYRDKKRLVVQALFLSFIVHFTTAAMYFFTALAIGVSNADFWQVTFGSSIQILATVLSPFTIAGEGIREAAQYLLLSHQLGAGNAIVSAALGFWAAEALTLAGGFFWWIRPKDYTPSFCLVEGQQVDYAEAAKAAASLETEEEKARHDAQSGHALPPMGARVVHSAGLGLGGGILSGILIGLIETIVIAQGGGGEEAQVFWYGFLAYSVILGGLGMLGGAVLGVLPMDRHDAQGWVPSLAMLATLVPFGLAITVFRLRRDVYLEQMPPVPVLLGVLAAAGGLAVVLFLLGPRLFRSGIGRLAQPAVALSALAIAVLFGLVASLVAGPQGDADTHHGGVPAALEKQPNVILIMVDTLRADHLSCYGGDLETPNICSLAGNGGSRFQGFSAASWTKPATASLLTSLLPSSHNAMSKPSALSPDVELISEVLKDRGYTTGGIATNINLAASFGFDQGYDEYHYLGPDYLAGAQESSSKLVIYSIVRAVWFKLNKGLRFGDFYQDSAVVNEVAFDWLERHATDRFFLFLHYMDPHDPYFEHTADGGYTGTAIARVSNQHPDEDLAAEMHRLYNGEIEYLDRNVGRLLDRLKAQGLYDDSVIALVADHGEEFYEHGGWWHGLTLYEEQIHVPLLIKWAKGKPQAPASSVAELARLLDVAPTLIAATGTQVPAAMQGIDLMGEGSTRAQKDLEVYSEEDHEGNVLWSLRTKTMKMIQANADNPRGLEETELYDMSADPNEMKNLAGSGFDGDMTTLATSADMHLKAALGEAIEGGGDATMTKEDCLQLMNLGYVADCDHIQ